MSRATDACRQRACGAPAAVCRYLLLAVMLFYAASGRADTGGIMADMRRDDPRLGN